MGAALPRGPRFPGLITTLPPIPPCSPKGRLPSGCCKSLGFHTLFGVSSLLSPMHPLFYNKTFVQNGSSSSADILLSKHRLKKDVTPCNSLQFFCHYAPSHHTRPCPSHTPQLSLSASSFSELRGNKGVLMFCFNSLLQQNKSTYKDIRATSAFYR